MSKPKICEILSVDVSEVFGIEGYSGEEFYINAEGDFCSTKCQNKVHRWYALMDVLNEKKKIILQMRWTQQDKDVAKAVRLLFPEAKRITRSDETDDLIISWDELMPGDADHQIECRIGIDIPAFQNLGSGESVSLDEILKAEVQA